MKTGTKRFKIKKFKTSIFERSGLVNPIRIIEIPPMPARVKTGNGLADLFSLF
jgi:hypothetical protein